MNREKDNVKDLSGSMEPVEEFRKAIPDRIIPSLMVSENELTLLNFNPHSEHNPLPTNNYLHFQENLSQLVPLFAFAAENGVPVGIHLEIGPPDVAYDFTASDLLCKCSRFRDPFRKKR